MGKIYQNQTKLRFAFNIIDDEGDAVDVSAATTRRIKWIKRGGAEGYWDATGGEYSNGVIYYDVQSVDDLDTPGTMILWTYITFADGNSAPSEAKKVSIYKEGQ